MTTMSLRRIKSSGFWVNYKLGFKNNKKILIIITVLQLIAMPLFSAVLVTECLAGNYNGSTNTIAYFMLIACFGIVLATLSGIVVAINNFSYLYKKTQVDMIYSLPIKASHRFFSDFLSGLSIYVLPYIGSFLIAFLILLGGSACDTEMYTDLFDNRILLTFFQCALCGLLIMTMLYTLTILVITCCGSLFEIIFNTLIMNSLIPGIIMIISFIFFDDLYGVSIYDTAASIIGHTSPLGGVIYIIYNSVESVASSDYMVINAVTLIKWILIYSLVTAGMLMLSMFLYLRRKAEDVSKPYVYKLLYYIVVTSVTISICAIARASADTMFAVIVFSAIVYFIFEVIANRGFRKFAFSVVRYVLTMISVFILCVVSIATDGFGIEHHIPSLSSIKSVTLSYVPLDLAGGHYYDSNIGVTLTDKASIELVRSLHMEDIKRYEAQEERQSNNVYDPEYSYGEIFPIKIKYRLKTGSNIVREYKFSFKEMTSVYQFDLRSEMKDYLAQTIKEDTDNTYYDYSNGDKKKIESYVLNIASKDHTLVYSPEITKDQLNQLISAYKKDYEAMTKEEYFTPENVYCFITNYNIPIRSSFKNTIDFIERNDLSARISHVLEDNTQLSNPPIGNTGSTNKFLIYAPDDCVVDGYTSTACLPASSQYIHTSGRVVNTKYMADILKAAQPVYITDKDCFMLNFGSYNYVIPFEYSELAHNAYNASYEYNYDTDDEGYHNGDVEPIDNFDDLCNHFMYYGTFSNYKENNTVVNETTEMRLYEIFNRYQFQNYHSFEDYAKVNSEDFKDDDKITGAAETEYDIAKRTWGEYELVRKFFGYWDFESYCADNDILEDTDSYRSNKYDWNRYENLFPNINDICY